MEVPEQPPPLADQHEQPAPGVVVLSVPSKMLGDLVDALGHQGYLDFGGPGVFGIPPVPGNGLRLLRLIQSTVSPSYAFFFSATL